MNGSRKLKIIATARGIGRFLSHPALQGFVGLAGLVVGILVAVLS